MTDRLDSARPRVVIVGAGFAGLTLARALRRDDVDVLMVDRNNYHTFQPLLYQVATAGLEPEEIAHSVRGVFPEHEAFRFRLGAVDHVDWDARAVVLEDGARLPYDALVLAAGTATNYFGVEGAREHAFALKSLTEAVNLRTHLIRQFERADQDPALIDDGALTFVLVGGGPTGVEMAGALMELFHMVLKKDFPHLPIDRARVVLLEMLPTLLAPFHEKSQRHAYETLRRKGVEVRFEEQVVRVTEHAVHLKGGETIPAETLIWTAGVRASTLADRLGLEQTKAGRVVVRDDLSVPGHPEVFVAGDMAGSTDADGDLHPQLAPVAMQHAEHIAEQLRRRRRGAPGTPFRYRDKGIMATIGRNEAVAELYNRIVVTGFPAWLLWLGLHIVELIGFRNRVNVLFNWAWNYVTYDRSARLITDMLPNEQVDAHQARRSAVGAD